MIVVSACNARYFPGVAALWNSFRQHNDLGRHSFVCVGFGDEALRARLTATGMGVLMNPPHLDDVPLPLPEGGVWDDPKFCRDAARALYCRIALPHFFPTAERVLWVDGDSNFIRSVDKLDAYPMNERAVAAPLTDKKPRIYGEMARRGKTPPNITTGTMLFDVERYIEAGYFEEMVTFMREHGDKFDDSTCNNAINWVLGGKVAHLPRGYSFPAKTANPDSDTVILHWSICDPWDRVMMSRKPIRYQTQVRKYWEPYRWKS